jgi:hypothetical protein
MKVYEKKSNDKHNLMKKGETNYGRKKGIPNTMAQTQVKS